MCRQACPAGLAGLESKWLCGPSSATTEARWKAPELQRLGGCTSGSHASGAALLAIHQILNVAHVLLHVPVPFGHLFLLNKRIRTYKSTLTTLRCA